METRQVTYYQILKPIKFTDGFEVKAGQKVMLLQEESGKYNVKLEDGNSKRFFWINISDVKLHSVKKEKWAKSKVTQHDVDVNDKWLENESRNTTSPNKIGTGTKSKRSERNSATVKSGGRKIPARRKVATGTKEKPKSKTRTTPGKKTTAKTTVKGTTRKRVKKA